MNIRELFDACATNYEVNRPKLVPDFDLFYGALVEAIPFSKNARLKVLDLGTGTGLLTAMLYKRFPNAKFLITDVSEKMLEMAKARFADNPQVTILNRDHRDLPERDTFDLIISALSLHHLSDPEKSKLYRLCFQALKPGGSFINADQVLGRTEKEESFYESAWQADVRSTDLPEHFLKEAQIRMLEDKNARLSDQLAWLEAAGFGEASSYYQRNRFCVFGGRKSDKTI